MKNYKHVTIEIEQDDCPGNPRDEFDNLSTFYGVSGRYITGGKGDIEYQYRDSLDDQIAQFKKEKAVIVEFSNNAGTCYAVVERSQLKSEYLDYGQTIRQALFHARKCAEGEIETFNQWAEGEVYGYIIKDRDDNILDSCWGFYGLEYAKEEAESAANYHEKELEKQEKQINSRLLEVCQ